MLPVLVLLTTAQGAHVHVYALGFRTKLLSSAGRTRGLQNLASDSPAAAVGAAAQAAASQQLDSIGQADGADVARGWRRETHALRCS